MTIDFQSSLISDFNSFPDWVFQTPGDQGPGPGPILRPVVYVRGAADSPILMTGTTSVANLQPNYREDAE